MNTLNGDVNDQSGKSLLLFFYIYILVRQALFQGELPRLSVNNLKVGSKVGKYTNNKGP